MRILLYIGILAACVLFPGKGTDVGRLIPVEVIAVSESEGKIVVRTDTQDQGVGDTLPLAFADLENKAPGFIYLDTAEYLMLEKGLDNTAQLHEYLKKSTKVYYAAEGIELDGIADYLSAHQPGPPLETAAKEGQIPEIVEENGSYLLTRKES